MATDDPRTVHALRASIPQRGLVEQILLSPARKQPLNSVDTATVRVGTGLVGDHHSERRPGGKRQVTLIQSEHVPVIASLSGHPDLAASLLRRNIVLSGIPVNALRGVRFRIGPDVVLEGTGPCDPCSRMEQLLGPGGYNAMRGMGGLTARVVDGGEISVGDGVVALGLTD